MINYQHPTRNQSKIPNQSVTLTQGDIYSITTGKITRSNQGPDMGCYREGLEINDPETLFNIFRNLANRGEINRSTPLSHLEIEWLEAERHPHS